MREGAAMPVCQQNLLTEVPPPIGTYSTVHGQKPEELQYVRGLGPSCAIRYTVYKYIHDKVQGGWGKMVDGPVTVNGLPLRP